MTGIYGEFGGLAPGEQFDWYDREINKTDRFIKMKEVEFSNGCALNAVRLRDGTPNWFASSDEVVALGQESTDD